MIGNFDRCMEHVLRWEGGFAMRPEEPHPDGLPGCGNKGISILVLDEWHRSHGMAPATVDDVKALDDGTAKQIYKEKFWDPIGGDSLPVGYDLALLTAAVMFGPNAGTADKPGALGFHAEAQGDLGLLVILMMQAKMKTGRCDPHVNPSTGRTEFFGAGWSDRFVSVYRAASAMVRS